MSLFRTKKSENRLENGELPNPAEKTYYLIPDEENIFAVPAVYEQKATSLEEAILEVQKPYWVPRAEPREATDAEVRESRDFMARAQELYDTHDELDSLVLADFIATLEHTAAQRNEHFDEDREVLIAALWDDSSGAPREAKAMLEDESIAPESEQALGVAKLVCRMRDIDVDKADKVLNLLLTTDESTQGLDGWIDPHYSVRERAKKMHQ